MSDELLFQQIYNKAYTIANKYRTESIYSVPIALQLINFFGKENIKWFYKICNRIQKQYN
ncbi:hypothetical protein D4Z93_08025 [Clostridium fermenticellae]|uniref:Uncharacterized protein n=1 Tax=Clostridium fermenticellae TaxID=2068654 RepID=A0A386H4Q1_9CLOT|nr:hypothetical protein [Clostridium fermenticellae]AYD40475.1 hypothetical protein D4Z93_08025 [Clostridium fermenticellae]